MLTPPTCLPAVGNGTDAMQNDFKMEPQSQADEMPTDLSTGSNAERKYNGNNGNSECYP